VFHLPAAKADRLQKFDPFGVDSTQSKKKYAPRKPRFVAKTLSRIADVPVRTSSTRSSKHGRLARNRNILIWLEFSRKNYFKTPFSRQKSISVTENSSRWSIKKYTRRYMHYSFLLLSERGRPRSGNGFWLRIKIFAGLIFCRSGRGHPRSGGGFWLRKKILQSPKLVTPFVFCHFFPCNSVYFRVLRGYYV